MFTALNCHPYDNCVENVNGLMAMSSGLVDDDLGLQVSTGASENFWPLRRSPPTDQSGQAGEAREVAAAGLRSSKSDPMH